MSSSSAEPTVSVVIGSNAPPACLEACLEALQPQIDNGVEVLVYDGAGGAERLRDTYPWATVVGAPGALVPFHWRDGINAATGDVVALTVAQMRPAPDWIATIRDEHREHDVVGGAIDPGQGLRLRDWAEYFCRYARDMRPFVAGENVNLAGDNATYGRTTLSRVRASYRDGFWEPDVHRAIEGLGIALWRSPAVLVEQGRSVGFTAFAAQRFAHGREHGRQRGSRFSRSRNVAGVAGAPIVPFVMTVRVLREVFSRGRFRARVLLAVPLVLALNAVWAAAEAVGHVDVLREAA